MAQKQLQNLEVPPGNSAEAYSLAPLYGEIIYVPFSKSIVRLLVTGKETENAFAVVGMSGSQGGPVGFHFHREAHDTFLCTRGEVNIWANDQCRTMKPGDFASIPPNTIHQFQILGDHTEFLGLIFPGGWEEFFRYIGDPYSGPLFPVHDDRNPLEILVPRIIKAQELYDMEMVPNHPFVEPQLWPEDGDDSLPGTSEPYYLQHEKGQRYLVGGLVIKPLATRAETAGKFSIASVEGSSFHQNGIFASTFIDFHSVHHCMQVMHGFVSVTLRGPIHGSARLAAGETLYIPAGTEFQFSFSSKYAMFYVFSNGGGLTELLRDIGQEYPDTVPPEKEVEWDERKLKNSALQEELGYSLS